MPAPYTTLIEVVNTVARSVGHPTTLDIPASQDEAIGRLTYYANLCGNELSVMDNWQFLTKTFQISIGADFGGQEEKGFDLPSDYHAMVDETQWNRNTQLPAVGPINAQQWQWLVVRQAMITTRFMWRIRDNKIWIKSPPSALTPQTLSFEYISKNWAIRAADGTPQELLVASADYHLFPWRLMVLYTRAKWLENEGFDSTAAYSDFRRMLNQFTGIDKGAATLHLVPGYGYPYIDVNKNIPDTGYGLG